MAQRKIWGRAAVNFLGPSRVRTEISIGMITFPLSAAHFSLFSAAQRTCPGSRLVG